MAGDWVCIGRFSDPYGVKGDIRLKTYTEAPEAISRYDNLFIGPTHKPIELTAGQRLKDSIVVRVQDIDTSEQAKRLKGQELFIRRENLPPLKKGEYYHADLVGLSVKAGNSENLGTIAAVHDFGAGPVIEVALDTPIEGFGTSLMLPFRNEVVIKVDIKGGTLVLDISSWLGEGETK